MDGLAFFNKCSYGIVKIVGIPIGFYYYSAGLVKVWFMNEPQGD